MKKTKPSRTILASLVGAIAMLCGNAVQALPTIANVSPDGTRQFQSSGTLSFTASSAAGVTNVTVALTITSLKGTSFLKNLTPASGLTITGPNTGESVSAALTSNKLYSAAIVVTDATGASTSTTVVFDTIIPIYIWEAEDWDYTDTNTSIANLYIDNPQTNAYAGMATTVEANNSNGGGSYRPVVPGLSTETEGDIPRSPYMGTGKTDYDVGFTDGGDFGNYTRHYPAGTYNLYARAAGGNGVRTESADISVLSGAATISGTAPYKFGVLGRGWQSYDFMPVTDSFGAMIEITFDGTPATLQVLQNQGSDNMNFFMLMLVDTNAPVPGPAFGNFYPDGAVQFQQSSALTLTTTSAPGVLPNDIFVQLTGTNLLGQGFVKQYTTANGLIVTGPSTNFNVSVPLTNNTTYAAFIQAIDQNGNAGTAKLSFDTINPSYTWDAEDFNYGSGNFFDNPQTDSYADHDGDLGVDYFVDNPEAGSHSYRNNPAFNGFGGPSTEGSGDVPRAAYTNGAPDYDIGFNDPANWENYTRTFPAGNYNIFVRGANGGGGNGNISIARVTTPVPVNTSSQTVVPLGSAAIPATGNWQKYVFAAMKDINGNLVQVTFDGTPQTLRAFSPSSANAQFYMLMPADTSLPVFSEFYPDGTGFFQRTNKLHFRATALDGIATNDIIVTVNGVVVNPTFTGTSTSRVVDYPGLEFNKTYTVSASARSLSGGAISKTVTFDTYSASNYQWESSDYNYTSNGIAGGYIDNPQSLGYLGLTASQGIDELEVLSGASLGELHYRPSPDGSTVIITTPVGGDLHREQFAPSYLTYRINWFGVGCWANYTRHYPAGKYNVIARFTEGGGATTAVLKKVTSDPTVANQTTSTLGTFYIPVNGWDGWEWSTLVDGATNPVVVTFDGSATTLRLEGPAVDDGQNANVGFFMLVPVPAPAATLIGSLVAGQIRISFPTVTGSSYQVEYKNNLTAVSWTPLGSPIAGNNAVQFVQDPATGSGRFYRVHIQ